MTSTAGLADRALAARRRTAFFVAFCTVAYLVLGESIVGALFGWGAFDADDTRTVALVLAAYSLGLPAVASSRIFQNTLYAIGDTSGPARIAAIRVGLAAVVGVTLMFPLDRLAVHGGELLGLDGVGWFGPLGSGIRSGSPDPHLGAVGLALGSACAAWLELALLSRRCCRSIDGTSGPPAVMARLAPATGAAVVVALLARWATDGLPAIAVAPIGLALAGGAYVLVAAATGVAEAGLITDPIRRRLHL
jgi:peptidoglycan biosynthesis protein MviN/MurJ (putative lipid II flippase)